MGLKKKDYSGEKMSGKRYGNFRTRHKKMKRLAHGRGRREGEKRGGKKVRKK